MGKFLSDLWTEELGRQLAAQRGGTSHGEWQPPTALRADASSPRGREGPIGFALDVLSAWHTELLRSLQFLARIKAEVIIPSSQGPQRALGVEDASSQAPRRIMERVPARTHPKTSYQGQSGASGAKEPHPKPRSNPGSHYGPGGGRAAEGGEAPTPKEICEGCGKGAHKAADCQNREHPNWNHAFEKMRFRDTVVGKAIRQLAGGGNKYIVLPPREVVWDANTGGWLGGKAFQDWKERLQRSNKPTRPEGESFQSEPTTQAVQRGKPLHLGVIRGASDVYPSVEGVLQSEGHPILQITVECLFDTGCLFSNFIKEDAAKQLGSNIREEDEEHRQVTLADGSLTSSVGSLSCNVMLRHKSHGTFSLHSICFHILTNLAFDVIVGYPCIRKHSLMSRFPSLFSETCLQVHNCTKCRQCLPGCFQRERAPKDGETCSEVLLAVPCAGALVNQRVPCRDPGGPVVNELICDRRGVGQASAREG